MWKINLCIKFLMIVLLGISNPLTANPSTALNMIGVIMSPGLRGKTEFTIKSVPLAVHENTYFIVKVMGEKQENQSNRFSYNFVYGKSRFMMAFFYFSHPIHSSVIPYASIHNSIYYPSNRKLNHQTSISEFCNNYFPIPVGEHIYQFSLYDNRRSFDLPHYYNYYVYRYFKINANQSIFIEVDIKNDSYTFKIIDTPEDIFSDMCK